MTKGWKQESTRHALARKGIKTKQDKLVYTPKSLSIKLPANISKGDLQWKGTVREELIEIYYDDEVSSRSTTNQYAVFSKKGFLGFLESGFAYPEIEVLVKKYKYKPVKYSVELYREEGG